MLKHHTQHVQNYHVWLFPKPNKKKMERDMTSVKSKVIFFVGVFCYTHDFVIDAKQKRINILFHNDDDSSIRAICVDYNGVWLMNQS